MSKAYVLLSGGIDSTTCLYLAWEEFGEVEGVSVFYGQRHRKEIEYAARSCKRFSARHHIVDLSSIIPKTMLTDASSKIPNISYDEIKGVSPTYVPFRNGLLLSAITAIVHGEYVKHSPAEKADEWAIYFGAHAEDAQNWAYPDCSFEWTGAMANAIYIGTYRAVRLRVPLQWLVKKDIIKLGDSLGVDWSSTWSCYKGGETHCGSCPTCRSRRKGFVEAGVKDPTEYASTP